MKIASLRIARLSSLVVLAVLGVFTAASAALAAPHSTPVAEKPAPATAHTRQAPRYPFVIDGVRYTPDQISRFDGLDLYFTVDLAQPKRLVGYTKKTDFDAAVARLRESANGTVTTQSAGQYIQLYAGDELTGDRLDVNSPWGINYLAGINRGCGLFGCAGTWDNVASSIYVNGRVTVNDGIEYTGSWLYFSGVGWANLSWYGFDNITSSLNVWW